MPKKKSNVPANETPEARFVRVATTKTNAILRNLKTLAKLKKSTAAQRTAIASAISDAVDEAMLSMAGQKTESGGFKL
jgi:hypothetical protein